MKKLALALLALTASACGKQTFLAAAFIATPQMANPVDPAHPIPSFAVMSAYLGTVDTSDPTSIDASKIGVVPGAKAHVAFTHQSAGANDATEDRLITVPESPQPGLYSVTSQDQSKLSFEQNVPYTLILETPGDQSEAFGARVTPGPQPTLQEFPPGATYVEHAVAHSFTVTRTDPPAAGSDRLPAFIVVGKIDPRNPGSEPQVTFKTVPAQPIDLLKFVLSDAGYRWASYTIPATAFPDVNAFYVVSVLAVRTGKVSANAFLGSTALAATGAGGLVHTHL